MELTPSEKLMLALMPLKTELRELFPTLVGVQLTQIAQRILNYWPKDKDVEGIHVSAFPIDKEIVTGLQFWFKFETPTKRNNAVHYFFNV